MYQWHRYEVFDMRHQPSIPSGKRDADLYIGRLPLYGRFWC